MSSALTNTMNITNNPPPSKCYEKCLYSFKYTTSSYCSVTNMNKQYFKLTYDIQTTNSPVTFNNVDYKVKYIGIYFPSLHNFNNSPVSGEIIIYHTGVNGTNLNVCIPLNTTSGTPCPLLNNILNEINSRQIIDNHSHDLSLVEDYNINSFVKYSPYFYYFDNTTHNNINYIVYGLNNGILITPELLKSMKLLIKTPFPTLKTIRNLNYNEKGPSKNGNDDIYIDCQPVDADGNLLIDKSNKEFYKKFNISNTSTSYSSNIPIIIGSVVGILILLIIIIAIFKNMSFIGLPSTNGLNINFFGSSGSGSVSSGFGLSGSPGSSTNPSRSRTPSTMAQWRNPSNRETSQFKWPSMPSMPSMPSIPSNWFGTPGSKRPGIFGSLSTPSRSRTTNSRTKLPSSLTVPAREFTNFINDTLSPLQPVSTIPSSLDSTSISWNTFRENKDKLT